jgi:hypothetical protein
LVSVWWPPKGRVARLFLLVVVLPVFIRGLRRGLWFDVEVMGLFLFAYLLSSYMRRKGPHPTLEFAMLSAPLLASYLTFCGPASPPIVFGIAGFCVLLVFLKTWFFHLASLLQGRAGSTTGSKQIATPDGNPAFGVHEVQQDGKQPESAVCELADGAEKLAADGVVPKQAPPEFTAGDEWPPFDVFLAHNSKDKPAVLAIAEVLKARGISYWIDVERIPPGRWFQDVIQAAIPRAKCAAVFLGPDGIGKWQVVEVRAFISQCVERGLPVIPVLLPGVDDLPQELLFLRELNWVKVKRLDEKGALDQLEWGITGKKPGGSLASG